jgi:hypothetical protein
MLLNILLTTFVTAFVAIVVLGHVLLITALWPNALGKRRESHDDAVAEIGARQPAELAVTVSRR